MKSILLVDDHSAVRTATRHYLESQTDYRVCGEAVDGLEALELMEHLTPDLIILDMSMPRLNGLQTAKAIRARKIGVPIILFTMYADSVTPVAMQGAGVNAVVLKTDFERLKREVESLVA